MALMKEGGFFKAEKVIVFMGEGRQPRTYYNYAEDSRRQVKYIGRDPGTI